MVPQNIYCSLAGSPLITHSFQLPAALLAYVCISSLKICALLGTEPYVCFYVAPAPLFCQLMPHGSEVC